MADRNPPILDTRCAPDGHACMEVTSRVAAGQQALHITGCPEQGRQLLATARRIAEMHGHGTPVQLEEAS